eukprot:TRINITY_DN391_c0_g1_i4.p2 TRINITY_DN391_c0_g1~~TRINITY_DN391_c0_g1_i4.p2  ORF type:complete len:109 (-),score=4.05 TRINITY_DN391_c0_g1_i4:36-362(-)
MTLTCLFQFLSSTSPTWSGRSATRTPRSLSKLRGFAEAGERSNRAVNWPLSRMPVAAVAASDEIVRDSNCRNAQVNAWDAVRSGIDADVLGHMIFFNRALVALASWHS